MTTRPATLPGTTSRLEAAFTPKRSVDPIPRWSRLHDRKSSTSKLDAITQNSRRPDTNTVGIHHKWQDSPSTDHIRLFQ